MAAGTCDIFAHRMLNGKRTNEISSLHKDLLGLGSIAKKFTRWKANRVFYLAQSKSFKDGHEDLIYDANGEPLIASMYEVAREAFNSASDPNEVTQEDIRQFLAKKFEDTNITGVGFETALNEVKAFNKEIRGANTYMATIVDRGDGKYNIDVVYNTQENHDVLIQTIADMQTAKKIVERLSFKGGGVNVLNGFTTALTMFGGAKFTLGIKGIIQLQEGDQQLEDLSKMTGRFIVTILGGKEANEHPLVKRLRHQILEYPLIIKEMLGEERYNDYINFPETEEDIILGEMVGYYLEHYESVRPKGLLSKVVFLLRYIVDYCKTHLRFSRRDFNKCMFDAKYEAWMLANDFMKGRLEKSLLEELSGKLDMLEIKSSVFNNILHSVKHFDILMNKVKSINKGLYKEFNSAFAVYMENLNNVSLKYKQADILARQTGTRDNVFIKLEIEDAALNTYVYMIDFLVQKMEEGVGALLKEFDPLTDITLSEHADIVKYNAELFKMAKLIIRQLDNIQVSLDMKPQLDQLKNVLLEALTNDRSIEVLETVTHADGTTTEEPRVLNIGSYETMILLSRRSLTLKLLLRINGGNFLAINQYVTMSNEHWYKVTRHKPHVRRIDLEVEFTDINPDFSWISRFIDSMADNPDIINQMIYDVVELEKHKANVKTLATRERLRRMYAKLKSITWVDEDGIERKGVDTELFYERYNNQLDEYGEPIIENSDVKRGKEKDFTGNLVSERNWGEWEREKEIYMKDWEEDYWERSFTYMINGTEFRYGMTYEYNGEIYSYYEDPDKRDTVSRLLRARYRKYFKQYVNSKADSVTPTFLYRRDMYKSTSYIAAYGIEMEKWHSMNSTKIPLTDSNGNKKYKEDGSEIQVYAPALFTDEGSSDKRNFYDNPLYKIFKDPLNQALLDWYNDYLQLKQSLDEELPVGSTIPFGLRAPLFRGTIVNRFHHALSGENSGSAFGMSLFNLIRYSVTQSPDDIEFGGENNTYNEKDLYDGQGSLIYDRAHSNALKSDERLPVYGVRKLKKLHELSTDLMHSTLAYAAMADNYSCLDEVVGAVEQTAKQLKSRRIKSDFNIEETENRDTPASYLRLQDYIRQQIFNDYNYNKDADSRRFKAVLRKLVGLSVRLSSLWFLAGNIHSALTNMVTAFNEIIKEAWAGTDFKLSDMFMTMFLYHFQAAKSIALMAANMFTEAGSYNEDRSKLTLFQRYYNVLNANERDFRDMHIATPGYSLFKGYSLSDFCMLPYTITDNWMQTIAYVASARALKLTRVGKVLGDGTIENNTMEKRSLWDLYTVRDGKLVCAIGSWEEWAIPDENNLKVKEILEKETGIDIDPDLLRFLDSFKDSNGNELPPALSPAWHHWDNEAESRFRVRCRGINNRLHGVYNRSDGGAILGGLIGPLILSLKKYAIGMFDRRFARARYDFRNKDVRQGSTITFANLFIDLVINAEGYSGEDEHTTLHWLDTTPVVRQIFGLLNLAFMYLTSMTHMLALGNDYRKKYLYKRGYSSEQIANIDRATMDLVVVFILRLILGICMPPDDEDSTEIDEQQDLWFGGRWLLTLYRGALLNTPLRKTIDDVLLLDRQAMLKKVKKESNLLPFSIQSILYYQTYRALREQYAYNVMALEFTSGPVSEIRSLTESMLPSFAGLVDMYNLCKECMPLITGGVTDEELAQMIETDPDAMKKYDNMFVQEGNPYGMEIYQRGTNKDWYKFSVHLIRQTPFLRSLRVWYNTPVAAANMEYATKSDILETMRKYNRKTWQGWANTMLNHRFFDDSGL